jgi:hypothetical protein
MATSANRPVNILFTGLAANQIDAVAMFSVGEPQAVLGNIVSGVFALCWP